MNPKTAFVQSLVEDKCDPELGKQVREFLFTHGLETVQGNSLEDFDTIFDKAAAPSYTPALAHSALADGIRNAFINLGLDVQNDPSIKDTPRRFANMFVGELTKGLNYDFFPKCTAIPNDQGYDQMVLVQGIQTVSLCEHHLQTIDGLTHIAYIPGNSVLGLSKFARVADFFAARPQIQERMTEQIFRALSLILGTEDIAVVQKCKHFCMYARGAKQPFSWTTTDKMGGRFMNNPTLRQEMFNAID